MVTTIKKLALRAFSGVFPEGTRNSLHRRLCRPLVEQFYGKVTDEFLEFLLRGMEVSFCLLKGYRENIEGFTGTYVFTTEDGEVHCSAVFADGDLDVESKPRSPYEARVTFTDGKALWRFLLSQNQDILNSILANDVDVDGNLNYIYKFGFLARDLQHRLGVV